LLYLYVDESGDLGFDFVTKRPSRFFTVCILAVNGMQNTKKITKAVQRTLRRKVNPKNKRRRIVHELKGSSTTLQVKKYFFQSVKDVDFYIYALTLNKKRVYQDLVTDKSRIYNWVTRLLLDNLDFSHAMARITLVLDKSKSKREIKEFNSYIKRQLEERIDPRIPLNIEHKDSVKVLPLQAADLFSWGIFRKYERKDTTWFKIFQAKVGFDSVYLP